MLPREDAFLLADTVQHLSFKIFLLRKKKKNWTASPAKFKGSFQQTVGHLDSFSPKISTYMQVFLKTGKPA